MCQAAGIIAKLRNYVSGRHLTLVYNCFAQCYSQYGVLCWGNSSKTIIEPLQKQPNKILKLMSGIKWNDYVKLDQVYHAKKMLKVSDIARLESVKFMYRYHKFKVPNLFFTENYFTPIDEIHSYNTRNEELVVQNLRREPHSSVTVCRFCKLKSCCYVIAIPSDWHCCPNPNCYARFRSKKGYYMLHLQGSCLLYHICTTHPRIEPSYRGLRAKRTNH